MNTKNKTEAHLSKSKSVLIVLSRGQEEELFSDFFGTRIHWDDPTATLPSLADKTVYLCGDIGKAAEVSLDLATQVRIIKDLSHGYEELPLDSRWTLVGLGQVPVGVHGLGVYYPHFFETAFDCFSQVCEEHEFQDLTESTKPGAAYRTGVYLAPVEAVGNELHFRLLRCSTNLSGPTENFRATDRYIVNALNRQADAIFANPASLNHVLAQIYHNRPATSEHKQVKAKIAAHADKTKDMPKNGIMAFCTFYDQLSKLKPSDSRRFDYGYKEVSGLTRLVFKRKKTTTPSEDLPEQFTVILYPDSVFFMPLSTNRLYTHEIRSSMLDANMLPTRMGYVVRCSATEAVHKEGRTFLKIAGKRIELEAPTAPGMTSLRTLYADQNKSEGFIEYGNRFLFSMNQGDYSAPLYKMADEFPVYSLPGKDNLFATLSESACFEELGKGREGAVLVDVHETRGNPIVRTTTKYKAPAQQFRVVHAQLAQQIIEIASLQTEFNNALIERYTEAYTKMGAHSDQALDLAKGSTIALFSCYKSPQAPPSRKLVVQSKEHGDTFEIPLLHNSIVVFSLHTNQRFTHKIVQGRSAQGPENHWLGVTFRSAKTFVHVGEEGACFEDGTPLALASEEQAREFYQLRGRENREIDFEYPELRFTLSESDRAFPVAG